MHKPLSTYPIDNSAILYLAVLHPNHSNTYRFTISLTEPICPDLLQQAADRVCPRFPTIVAGFRPGFFEYTVVPFTPAVAEDPGLLHTMRREEVHKCAYRIYYSDCDISIEAFHALTDGYGAVKSFRTLVAEYLYLRYGLQSPERMEMLESGEPDWQEELRDAYLDHENEKPGSVPVRKAYQLIGKDRDWQVRSASQAFELRPVLAAAKAQGVSLTAFLSCLMAETIMEIQQKESTSGHMPVRIMVPADLRRLFPTTTLRNYILYALPTLEPEEADLPRRERMARFDRQFKAQNSVDYLIPQVARNVRLQKSPFFRYLPRTVKCGLMRAVYAMRGECTSSITLTNLGSVVFSEEMKQYVRGIDVWLTPRRGSPYNCSVISCGDQLRINITRFAARPEMEELFFSKLRAAIEGVN